MDKFISDKDRLDFLQALLSRKKYTGRCILRGSTTGRGWRLHETSQEDAVESIREAIDQAIERPQAFGIVL